jgi:glutathione synthase/RimK-type ligase-like ATP-grasp enzyme
VTSVLVLDEGFMSGAHTAAGLAGAGLGVTVLAAIGGGLSARCVSDGVHWRLGPQIDRAEQLARAIVSDGAEADIIYPVTEPMRALSWQLPVDLGARVFPQTSAFARTLFTNKRVMAEYLSLRGVPTLAQTDATEHRALGYPCVIKGVRGRGGCATHIASSANAANAAVERMGAAECFAQEFIDGPTYIVGGLFDHGRALRVCAARKVKQYPAQVGPASRLQTVHAPGLLASALRAFESLNITGLASVDFIQRPSGEFAFLELNPRPWGSIGAMRDAGVDLFTPLADLLRGERPVADLSYDVGVSSSVFPLYLASRDEWRHPRSLAHAVAHDLASASGQIWHRPRQAAHLSRRLFCVARQWPSPRATY